MTLFGYIIEFNTHAKRSLNDIKVFKRSTHIHIVWYRFSLRFGSRGFCEECDSLVELGANLCDECHENLFCECGTELESPGFGFCLRCQ
jgi:hypothetical protein